MAMQIWTPALVRSHAQVAVTVELYTLPFYLTALTSIKDVSSSIYQEILSVCMEEMLHLELAANLCLAVGTTPNFSSPIYGQPIPYLDPDDPETGQYALINAVLGPLNQTTLDTMLNIETPEEFEQHTHNTPNYPYGSIGEMYDALLQGITVVGWNNIFVGNTTNQQAIFGTTNFSETIATLAQAQAAITTINEQGEGKAMQPAPTPPFTEEDFPIPTDNQLTVEPLDPAPLNTYAHYGRFVAIENAVQASGFPAVYSGISPTGSLTPAQQNALAQLQKDFQSLLDILNDMWAGTQNKDFFTVMMGLLGDAVGCWTAGVIPMWSPAQAKVTPKPLQAHAAR